MLLASCMWLWLVAMLVWSATTELTKKRLESPIIETLNVVESYILNNCQISRGHASKNKLLRAPKGSVRL